VTCVKREVVMNDIYTDEGGQTTINNAMVHIFCTIGAIGVF
jgi:hypothetical protein